MFNWNMENHPRQQYNHKAIWLWLGLIIRDLGVVVILPERDKWGGVDRV
jgi:hypothetical protein